MTNVVRILAIILGLVSFGNGAGLPSPYNLLAILGGFFVAAQALMFCNMADNLADLAKRPHLFPPAQFPPAQFSKTE